MGGELARVETALRTSVVSEDPHLTELASHLIQAGGKRLRPALSVAVAACLTGLPVTEDVVLGGVSVELVQVGSLYHDDVMDEATTRRGVESVNARFGNLKAILSGDFLLAQASALAASLGGADKMGVTPFKSGRKRMLMYHSSSTEKGCTPRVISW